MATFKLNTTDRENLTSFLRDLVRIPSFSTEEQAVAKRIITEMKRLGFQDVRLDRIGNVVGWIGSSRSHSPHSHQHHRPILMFNGHMDTVRVSDDNTWTYDPFGATIEDGRLYGLGACDMKGGLAAMIYAAHLLRNVQDALDGQLVVACVVQEEPSEGVGSRVLIEEEGLAPDWVVVGEPSNLNVSRGHRGRIEMRLTTYGRSAHAATPTLGENAIYATARLVFGLELLAEQLGNDPFLGAGTLAVTHITSTSSSRNAIPDRCELTIDRRLTVGENETKALAEVQRVISREGVRAEVIVPEYRLTSYTGYTCQKREFYPVWIMPEDHPLIATAAQAVREQLKRRPQIIQWDFSTEAAYIGAEAGIPTVGLGPGDPHLAHTPDEHILLSDVYAAAEVYAKLAAMLLGA